MAPHDYLQAQFVPISPGFDLHSLVQCSENLDFVTRVSKDKLKHHSFGSIDALVSAEVIQRGKPLVIEGWGSSLPSSLYGRKWLEDNLGYKIENVRDISNEANIPMTIGHYLRSMEKLTQQFTTLNYKEPRHQRLYLKDIDCPNAWAKHLKAVIPESVFYLNEYIGNTNDCDAEISTSFKINHNGEPHSHKGISSAGDLMSSLPSEMRALNLMCYIGHDGTYTAAHREMCATIGHNIMVEASNGDGVEREGSSIWFMTETKEREVVLKYFSAILGHDVDVEKHFAQINAWKEAPFTVWVVEQKVGDLIIIPPLATHQVWNRGTHTIKVAWNRTTVDTLEYALHESLPNYRMVCRDEQYKCKAIVYYTLEKYFKILSHNVQGKKRHHGQMNQLQDDFRRLFFLYQEIILSEMFSSTLPEEKGVEMLPFDSCVTCSYCRCNIFNRFLTCKICNSNDFGEATDTYDICMDCYAMGRSCACLSNLSWVEQWDWKILVDRYEHWRSYLVRFYDRNYLTRYPQPLERAKMNYGKKSIAEVCQEQLRIRPWKKTKSLEGPDNTLANIEPRIKQGNGSIMLKGRKKAKSYKLKNKKSKLAEAIRNRCHVCRRYDWNWKMAFCSYCSLAYCYSVLWLKFDLMPQIVMANSNWRCPRCLNICSCKECRKFPIQKPYEPEKILLGHNTKKVADYRSVESLVDFSRSKLICSSDEANYFQESMRIKRLKVKIEAQEIRETAMIENAVSNKSQAGETTGLTARWMNYIDPSLLEYSNNIS